MASTCSANFTIQIIGTSACTLTIPDPPSISASGVGTSTPGTVSFTYTPGTDHNPTSSNYGFSLNAASGMYPAGVTITGITWGHNEPGPAARTAPLMSVNNNVSFDINLSAGYSGDEQSFGVTISLNTGV